MRNVGNLHDFGNRLLEHLKDVDGPTGPVRILGAIAEFRERFDVADKAEQVLREIRGKCEEILEGKRFPPSIDSVDHLRNLMHELKVPQRQSQVRRRASPASAGRGAVPVTVLFIDDSPLDLAWMRECFEEWLARDAPETPFAFRILTLPNKLDDRRHHYSHFESSDRFLRLFRELLSDSVDYSAALGEFDYGPAELDALRDLQAIVFDLDLSFTHGAKIDGIGLAEEARRLRPQVGRYLLTGRPGMWDMRRESEDAASDLFRGVCMKNDVIAGDVGDLFFSILRDLRSKYETPFWSSLRAFAERPVIACHAMALARGRSANRGATIRDFVDFYGANPFRAEASATVAPLDSLLHPTGSIAAAQRHAARAFGSWRTQFVTNGTSTSNKIVLQALLSKGDIVLVDRNCHISHHYAIALARARPYYLEPYSLPQYRLSGGIPMEEIRKKLRLLKPRVPRALLLTNCTFDGVICNPQKVIQAVEKELGDQQDDLKEIAFVFDEAWFAYARFHPLFVERTAMHAAASLAVTEREHYGQRLRVYATQSTHKTLSAFRQASMIHSRDPLMERRDRYPTESTELNRRREHAFLSHTSTSPNSGLIASLDVSRRQVELEGTRIVGDALRLARRLRSSLARQGAGTAFERYFRLITEDELVPTGLRSEFICDPTKLTLEVKTHRADRSVADIKKELLRDYDLQFNKYSDNTILLMITVGASETSVYEIERILLRYAEELERKGIRATDAPPPSSNEPGDQSREDLWVPAFSGFGTDFDTVENDLGRYYFNDDRQPVERRAVSTCKGEEALSAGFVVPYPPGFPVLVPGQRITDEMIDFLLQLETEEIHGAKRDGRDLEILVYPPGSKPPAAR